MEPVDLDDVGRDAEAFAGYVFAGLATKPTRRNLLDCLRGRLIEARRKTHQPLGIALAEVEEDADALRQRLNRATLGPWPDEVVRERLRSVICSAIPSPVAWIIDDTGVEKKGKKSPGVQRQYCGAAGKVTNCQLFVSTHLASFNASAPLEMELYVPEGWCNDAARRDEAGIPAEVAFRTKGQIALGQLDRLLAAGVPRDVVLADAGYGDSSGFRDALAERGLSYAVAVKGETKVWRPGQGPDPVPPHEGRRGAAPTRRYPGEYQPVSVKELAVELAPQQYRSVRLWRGRHEEKHLRFAAVRVRTAHRAQLGSAPGDEQWLLIEWPEGAAEPDHTYLSNLPRRTRLSRFAELAKLRWRVERDYQDLKQEVGLDHYEGRRWRGLQHHVTLCMAAFVLLLIQRRLSPLRPLTSMASARRELQIHLRHALGHCPQCKQRTRPATPRAPPARSTLTQRVRHWLAESLISAGRYVEMIKQY